MRFVVQTYSWPTPSGWVEQTATEYCTNYILNTTIGAHCQSLLQIQFESVITSCVEDIQVKQMIRNVT